MKRCLTIVVLTLLLNNAQAQTHLFGKKWHKRWDFTTFGSLSLGNTWFNNGNFSALSAPVGMQITRELNKNLYSFGRLSVAPTYFNFNTFNNPGFNKAGDALMINSNIYPRAEAGLFYINDQKTFSISGSVFIEKAGYFYYPGFIQNKTPSVIK